MSLILSGTDGLSDVDGTAATPAIRGTDANTGIFFPAADTIAFAEGGAEAMRIDSSGNLGLGVTPSVWTLGKAIEVGFAGNAVWGNAAGSIFLTQNMYYDGNFRYKTTAAASNYQQSAGSHIWYNAPSGTAGNVITFTQAMTLDASGNLGIGVTSPTSRLHVSNSAASSNAIAQFTNGTTGTGAGNGLYVGVDTSNEATVFNFYNSALKFGTNAVERARFNSTGALVFAGGTTTANGIGITFPATQSASSDANTLDDYEEGTWTPVATNLTVVGSVSYVATYTKIGRVVYINLRVNSTTSSTSTSNSTYFDGLPFEPAINSTVTAVSETNIASLGVGMFANGARIFAPSWTAISNATLSGFYYV